MDPWATLGAVDPRKLTDARLQLHWAAQAASAAGKQLLEHRPDYGEQSFRWSERSQALVQGLVEGLFEEKRPFRPALRPARPALLLLGADGEILSELLLDGHTLDEAYNWLSEEIEGLLGRPLERTLERPGDLPAHPVGMGAPFSTNADGAAFVEIGRYFSNLDRALRRIEDRNPGASPVRCWPHHFDLATLIVLDPKASAEEARSIGVGLSPGDPGIPEPYLYVLPWPASVGKDLPELAGGGRWQTEGWTGGVLEATRFTSTGTNGAQGQQVEAFLDSAVAACHRLLG